MVVGRVTWDELGRPKEPGEYTFKDGLLNLRKTEIEAAKAYPDAVFNLVRVKLLASGPRYSLGTFESELAGWNLSAERPS